MFLNKRFHTDHKSIAMSAPMESALHGVAIKKLPIGKYIQAMRALDGVPALLLGEAFPECQTLPELLNALGQFDKDKMVRTAARLLTVVPEQACKLISGLLDIPEARLLDPASEDGLSPAQLAEILEAFWKVNDLSDFFGIVRRLTRRQSAPNTGFSAG